MVALPSKSEKRTFYLLFIQFIQLYMVPYCSFCLISNSQSPCMFTEVKLNRKQEYQKVNSSSSVIYDCNLNGTIILIEKFCHAYEVKCKHCQEKKYQTFTTNTMIKGIWYFQNCTEESRKYNVQAILKTQARFMLAHECLTQQLSSFTRAEDWLSKHMQRSFII